MSLSGRTSAADALAPLKQLHKDVSPRIDDRSVVSSDAVLAGGTSCSGCRVDDETRRTVNVTSTMTEGLWPVATSSVNKAHTHVSHHSHEVAADFATDLWL
jgi:hypothetical protein